MSALSARAIALYLPQFHPVPENDAWWGPGFTEWTNVARARPLFRGHVQPHLPADLGFYDLRLEESRAAQAELAQRYGIEAFCYWHYWFGNGRTILGRPFAEVLASDSADMKLCVAWANESWTGIWHGNPGRILAEQTYPGEQDDRAHFAALLPAFTDDRYVRVNGRPVFHVYKPWDLPDPKRFVDFWQGMARGAGLGGLYLVAAHYPGFDSDGFDAAFLPRVPIVNPRRRRLVRALRHRVLGHPRVFPYPDAPVEWPHPSVASGTIQPCVVPNWDNSPRSGRNAWVLTDATPEKFRVHVRHAVTVLGDRPNEERLLWIKSWNEWAEGNYLEPDLEYGHARLQVLLDELQDVDPTREATPYVAADAAHARS